MIGPIEGTCREVQVVTIIGTGPSADPTAPPKITGSWLAVRCSTHRWSCEHKHTKWGAVLRCVARHVASEVEK